MLKILSRVGIGVALLIVGLLIFVMARFLLDARVDYDVSTEGTNIPEFEAMDIPFDQTLDNSQTLPFAAGAIIDVDGDGVEEIFLGGARDQGDALARFEDGSFRLIEDHGIEKNAGEASHGATVLDVDKDGDDDLLVARTDGIWLHRNIGGTFSTQRLDAEMPADTTPLSIALTDINMDGHFDMFVSGYIRNDLVQGQDIFNLPSYGGDSQMFLNNGDDSFENITRASGLEFRHNTFLGIFVDVDNDLDPDLVVAHDTGQVRTWRNNGAGVFTNIQNPNSEFNSYPMGIAVGDYDNDGRVDFFFSNVGSTAPDFLIRGDTTEAQNTSWKWMLFRNEGDFQFSDQAETARLADYEFSWGAIFEDLNLDGREDLIVSENFIGFPAHRLPFLRLPGRLLVQNLNGEFAAVGAEAGVINRRYSIAPLTADFNGDGRPDIVHVNIAGRSQAFLSRAGPGNFLKIRLPNQVESIAARVSVTLADGSQRHKWMVHGEGLASESSPVLIFGLGDQTARLIVVQYLNGSRFELEGDFSNETIGGNRLIEPAEEQADPVSLR